MPQPDKDQIVETLRSIWASIYKSVPPVHKEGHIFIAAFAVITVLLAFFDFTFLFAVFIFLTMWCVAFFRDKPRVTPLDPSLVVSPADGTISAIDEIIPPLEMEIGDAPRTRISIFMSVFDGHIQRAPVAGTVKRIVYSPGLFLNADLDKASEDNERNSLVIESNGRQFGIVQIAGLVARRIVCFVKENEEMEAGERFGMIRFGSRVDIYLPDGAHHIVAVGQKTISGETVLAEFNSAAMMRTFKAE